MGNLTPILGPKQCKCILWDLRDKFFEILDNDRVLLTDKS